ncbi:tetratricopeptide repeat protein [Candidatus Latescibacterota bacterium]
MLPRVARLCIISTALTAAALASAAAQAGKIPITTSSETARQAFLEGRELFDKLRAQDSRAHFQRAVAEDPDFALAHLQLAFTEPTFRGFFDGIDRAVSLADGASDGEQLWIRGVKAGVDARAMDQRSLYRELVAAYPGDERAHTLLGNHFFAQQEYELAIASYETALDVEPEFSQPYNQMGYAYRFQGDYGKAEEAFEKYIELIPDDPNPYDSYAELLMKMGRYEESIATYQKALLVDPRFVASHVGIATNHNYLGQYAAARRQLRLLEKGARTDGERRVAIQATAISCMDEGDVGAAMASLSRQYQVAEANDDPGAMAADLGLMGDILLDEGAVSAARILYEKAHDLVQSSGLSDEVKANNVRNYLYDMTRIAAATGDLETARAHADEYSRQAREMQNGFLMRLGHELKGIVALAAGDADEALQELALASQQDPYNLYRTGQAHLLKGEKREARQWLERTAGFNALNNLNHTLVRHRAQEELDTL